VQTLEQPFRIKELGRVKEIKKCIAKIEGLPSCMNGQLLHFPNGSKGLVMGFNYDEALSIILGYEGGIRMGDSVEAENKTFEIPIGEGLVGRVVNALGLLCDGGSKIRYDASRSVFKEAPPAMERGAVSEPLETGIKIVDIFVPIAKGQRVLLLGDRMSGKTSIAVDGIINQKNKNVICIYCSIGKSHSSLLKITQLLNKKNAFGYTIILAAGASASCGEQYLAPYTATTIGEYFMNKGKDVLLIYDDLTKHAWAYRQLSLLLERPPGREAYPGDIYYVHSQLLERCGKLSHAGGGGSITAFVIADTLQEDIAGYIPSNLVSMLDGQIFLSTSLFSEGFKPAIDFGMSVSTIGGKIQHPMLRQLAVKLRVEYAEYRKLLKLTKLKAVLSQEAEVNIRRGEIITELLKQPRVNLVSIEEQIVLFYALDRGVLNKLSDTEIIKFKNNFFDFLKKTKPTLIGTLKERQPIKKETAAAIDECLKRFF